MEEKVPVFFNFVLFVFHWLGGPHVYLSCVVVFIYIILVFVYHGSGWSVWIELISPCLIDVFINQIPHRPTRIMIYKYTSIIHMKLHNKANKYTRST